MLEAEELIRCLEALLFSSSMPLKKEALLGFFPEYERPSAEALEQALVALTERYRDRGVHLVQVSTGFRFQSDPQYACIVGKLFEEKPPRYSKAFMEILSIIAYRQPVTRSEIEAIRGVGVNPQIIKTLEELEWIKTVGQKEVPGRPFLYATTPTFLDHFSLKSLSELPPLTIDMAADDPIPAQEALSLESESLEPLSV